MTRRELRLREAAARAAEEAPDAALVDPAPDDAAPLGAAPLDPAPIDAAALDPAPVDSAPLDPAPLDPAPVDAAPLTAVTRRSLRVSGRRATHPASGRRAAEPASARRRARREAAKNRRTAQSPAASGGTVKTRSRRRVPSEHPTGKPSVAAEVTALPGAASGARGRVVSIKRRIISNLVSVSAMAGVGLMLVATTVPANAFSRPEEGSEASQSQLSSSGAEKTQQLEVPQVAALTVTRDSYTVISKRQQLAAKEGNRLFTYTNDPLGTVQWPFPTGSPITSGFGGRHVAGCGFCSTYHQGVDFTPGAGTPIHSIADGVVVGVEVSNAGLGNHVIIEHEVGGQTVQSVYAHMQYGSIKVAVGQLVTVGQEVGDVGSTGASTGAHLHLEVHLDGVPVDPFAWLEANAN